MRFFYPIALGLWTGSFTFLSQVVSAQNETDATVSLPFCSDLVDSTDSFDVSYGYGTKTCKWAKQTCTEEVCMIDEVKENCPRLCEVECLTDSGAVSRAQVVPSNEPTGAINRQKTQIVLWSIIITAFVATVAFLLKKKQIKTVDVQEGVQEAKVKKMALTSRDILNVWRTKRRETSVVNKYSLDSVCESQSSQEELPNEIEDTIDIEDASTGEGEQEVVLVSTTQNTYLSDKSKFSIESDSDDEESAHTYEENSYS